MSMNIESSSSTSSDILLLRPCHKNPQKNEGETSVQLPQGQNKDWVTISEDGKTLQGTQANNLSATAPGNAEQVFDIQESDTLQATSAAGTQVSVSRKPAADASVAVDGTAQTGENQAAETASSYTLRLAQADGSSLDIDFTDNIRIKEGGKAGTSVYFAESDVTRTYGIDGSVSEAAGNTIEDDASSIIVNTRSDALHTGNGNNLIFNWADNADITTGSGNDTIVLRDDAKGNTIHTGDGDDTVIGKLVTTSTIDLGQGDNTLSLGGVYGSRISAGDGSNDISIQKPGDAQYYSGSSVMTQSELNLGNGNNRIDVGMLEDGSAVTGGNGDNTFHTGGIAGNSSLILGDGNNSVHLNKMGDDGLNSLLAGAANADLLQERRSGREGTASIQIGNGENTLYVDEVKKGAAIDIGNGNNIIAIYDIQDDGQVSLGHGNNMLSIHDIGGEGSLTLGNGNNAVRVATYVEGQGRMAFGNGNNGVRASVGGNGSIEFGDGDNAVRIGSAFGSGYVSFGNGSNNVSANSVRDNVTISAGDGDNLVVIKSMEGNAALTWGEGNNMALIGQTYGNVSLPDKNAMVFDQLGTQNKAAIFAQYAQRYAARQKAGLPTAASALNSQSLPDGKIINEFIKHREDPAYFSDMDSADRLMSLMRNIDYDADDDLLWTDAMRDPATVHVLDTFA